MLDPSLASYYLMTLQQQLPNGKNGAIGPNAQPLVARGPKSGPVLAVNQLLEALKGVLATPQRLNDARHPSAKVKLPSSVSFII